VVDILDYIILIGNVKPELEKIFWHSVCTGDLS
jgi:hypothetical protein